MGMCTVHNEASMRRNFMRHHGGVSAQKAGSRQQAKL
jgi:hypothetical protein